MFGTETHSSISVFLKCYGIMSYFTKRWTHHLTRIVNLSTRQLWIKNQIHCKGYEKAVRYLTKHFVELKHINNKYLLHKHTVVAHNATLNTNMILILYMRGDVIVIFRD